jgi:phage major head subunit gpT-like protein
MIGAGVPKHLVVAAQSGFLQSMRARDYPWQKIAMQLNMSAASVDLVDLGAAPMPKISKSGVTIQDFIEKTKAVTPQDWDITVWISQNAMDDDQTGNLDRRVRAAGDNFQKHINKRVFEVLNAGDSTTYGLAYDGQDFFDSDHVDKGADYQTAQDNEDGSNLTLNDFNTTWVNAQQARDDQGEYTQYMYDLLVCHPSNNVIAANITGNAQAMDTASREANPYAGRVSYITSPYLDTNAWFLTASSEPNKPLILAMKKQPVLQSAWFDATAPDGGRHYFKFFGRYEVHYGDWRLAWMGQT